VSESPIIREVSALQEALLVVMNAGVSSLRAREAARKALAHRTPSPSLNPLLNEVIQTALRKIAGEPAPRKKYGSPTRSSSEEHLIETASIAWLNWASGGEEGRIDPTQIMETRPNESGALHRTTLLLWLSAIERLEANDLQEARRLWQRAIEIGSSLGTESHPAILWSYAASFFP
jgi:hypothetical protein